MLDLKPEYLAIIQKILADYLPNASVWAYGSRVTGAATPTSDLDLVVRGSPPIDLVPVRMAFSESNLPIFVDIFDWETLPENFQKTILRAHEVIKKPL